MQDARSLAALLRRRAVAAPDVAQAAALDTAAALLAFCPPATAAGAMLDAARDPTQPAAYRAQMEGCAEAAGRIP